jgi:antitoxin PrlF
MPIATVTSKGQVTLPKEIREQLKLEPGSRINFVVDRKGRVTLTPLNYDFESLCGMLKSRAKHPVSIEEMNEAIARGWSGT